jgi:hypothetical protein
MNEDGTQELTKELSDSEKLAFLVEEAIANRTWQSEMRTRLEKVEAFVDERSRETRPMLELIVKEVADLGQSVKEIRTDLKLLRQEMWHEKRERADLEERVTTLEARNH